MPATSSKTVRVNNSNGLHARVAASIAALAQEFGCRISLVREKCEADATSILDILTLGAPHGAPIEIRATGRDAENAVQALARLFEEKLQARDHVSHT